VTRSLTVECLACGDVRAVIVPAGGHLNPGECARCGYLGWAPSDELTEPMRRSIREAPLEHRATLSAV
jgi:uncharacterized protein (DUF2461 family)